MATRMVKLMYKRRKATEWKTMWLSDRVAALSKRDELRRKGYDAEVI